jgi:prevent-host-death family protein
MTITVDYDIFNWSLEAETVRRRKPSIQKIAISDFKARCLALLDQVSKTKTPLRVTRRGRPIADVFPPSMEKDERSWIGSMTGSLEITGDIVSPVIDTDSIEAMKN